MPLLMKHKWKIINVIINENFYDNMKKWWKQRKSQKIKETKASAQKLMITLMKNWRKQKQALKYLMETLMIP